MGNSYRAIVYDIKWNDPNYINEWFEVAGYEDENIDIETIVDEQEVDCNQYLNRIDLSILTYKYRIECYA
jgi:hypothetical protein